MPDTRRLRWFKEQGNFLLRAGDTMKHQIRLMDGGSFTIQGALKNDAIITVHLKEQHGRA